MEDKEKIMADSMAELSRTLASVKDSALLEDFLKALLTPQEYNAVASRWALVRLLDQGMTQRKIAETLGLSLCKITRGSREMKKEESSFRKMIDICKHFLLTELKDEMDAKLQYASESVSNKLD